MSDSIIFVTGVPGKGWLSANDACDWFRVMCNQEGFVTQLDFVTEST